LSDIVEDVKKELLGEVVKDYEVSPSMTVCELVEKLGDSHGFMAGHVYRASRILAEMTSDPGATRILAFTGNIVSTGLRGVLAQMIREGWFHAVITTCGAIDHDIARSTGGKYYKGDWGYDDSMLRAIGVHRLGNVLIPVEDYGLVVEKFARRLFEELVREKRSGV